MTAAELATRIGARRSGRTWTATCPACGYASGLRIADGDRDPAGRPRVLLHCFGAGCDFEAILRAVGAPIGAGSKHPAPTPRPDDAQRARAIRGLWARTLPAADSPVECYLRSRRITGPIPAAIRYLPRARHAETGLEYPVMVAAVATWPSNNVVALHRTFLTADGCRKAPVEPQRKSWGPIVGGAVRLGDVAGELVVAEGVETTLAAIDLLRVPGWAALSAGGIRRLVLSHEVIKVTVVADHDPVGLAAAHQAAIRWRREGRTVRIVAPAQPGEDANDLLREAPR